MENKQFKCPLCDSSLSKTKYFEVVRLEEQKKTDETKLKKQLDAAKKNKDKLLKEKETIQRKLEKEKAQMKKKFEEDLKSKAKTEADKIVKKNIEKINKEKNQEILKVQKEFLAKGKEHEKKRTDKLTKSLKTKADDLQNANKQIKELKEQLDKGTTPQTEGLDMEKELVKELQNRFPEDKIEHKGHAGDILQHIMYKSKKIGLVAYECKKTQKFQKDYIKQIKTDVVKRNATYGVLVTAASDKGKSGFWVEDNILVVHPYGTIYIAEFLRKFIIELYLSKLTKNELSEYSKDLLTYVKSDKFKNHVQGNIDSTRELVDILNKERKAHENIWKKREKHYEKLSENSSEVKQDFDFILRNVKEDVEKIKERAPIQIIQPRRRNR